MNRQEFMKRLEKRLRRLPSEEYNEAISYYEQYFDDAENDDEVIAKLGSPDTIANHILADFATDKTKPKSWNIVWIIILSVFASPVALPIALAFAITAIALVGSAFVIIASIVISSVAIVLCGVVGAIISFAFIAISPASTIFFVGVGLVCVALGIEFFAFAKWLAKKSSVALSELYGKMLRRSAS